MQRAWARFLERRQTPARATPCGGHRLLLAVSGIPRVGQGLPRWPSDVAAGPPVSLFGWLSRGEKIRTPPQI
jgi:hypothetical protein